MCLCISVSHKWLFILLRSSDDCFTFKHTGFHVKYQLLPPNCPDVIKYGNLRSCKCASAAYPPLNPVEEKSPPQNLPPIGIRSAPFSHLPLFPLFNGPPLRWSFLVGISITHFPTYSTGLRSGRQRNMLLQKLVR